MFNITNYKEHPTNPLYLVYRFSSSEASVMFQELLKEKDIFFEADATEGSSSQQYLIAVKSKDEEKATYLNYTVLGKFREPFITNKKLGWAVIIFSGAVLFFAVLGYFAT